MTNNPDVVTVTRADREAAAMIYRHFRDPDYAGWILNGENAGGDFNIVIQAFARHRVAAIRALEGRN